MTGLAFFLLAAAAQVPIAHRADLPPDEILIWNDDGKQRSARAADLARTPKDAKRISVRTLAPAGKPILEVRLRKGQHFAPVPPGDIRIYVASGRLRLDIAGVKAIVSEGDAFFEAAGRPVAIDVLEDSLLIEFPDG